MLLFHTFENFLKFELPMMTDNSFLQVYLGEDYVNSPTLSDVTFLVEGLKNYYFHISLSYFKLRCIILGNILSNVIEVIKLLLA
jgi:hypothetical protein